MKDESKTKDRLIQELLDLCQRVVQSEKLKTEHKNITEALLESESLYKMVFENVNDGIIIHDTEDHIFEINRQTMIDLEIFSQMMDKLSETNEEQSLFEAAQEAKTRIKSITYIRERLYAYPSISMIDFTEFATRLVRFISALYPARGIDIGIRNEMQHIYLDLAKAVPLALIINELLSNSLKQAFHCNKKGRIIIEITREDNGKHLLLFFDNGTGFPETIDFRNIATIGMQIVTDMVDQLDGKIEFNTDKGTECMVEF